MMKAPGSKSQIPRKHQDPSLTLQRNIKLQTVQPRRFRGPFLKFKIWSFPGAWCLMFGASLLALTIHPALSQNLLLSGATVHTISGETLSPGKVLIQNGKIAAVGTTIPP